MQFQFCAFLSEVLWFWELETIPEGSALLQLVQDVVLEQNAVFLLYLY